MQQPTLQSNRQSNVHSQRGFTLVELMITVVIVSILASIAIPSYTSYIQKSRRTDAKSALLNIASLEERYFSTNNTYTNLPVNLGYPATTPLPPLPFTVGSGYYQVTVAVTLATPPANNLTVGTPATYTITATTFGSQVNDAACTSFILTSAGQQTATGSPTASVDCWK
jgi:type IV pilus assembly protein PilE